MVPIPVAAPVAVVPVFPLPDWLPLAGDARGVEMLITGVAAGVVPADPVVEFDVDDDAPWDAVDGLP